MANIVNVNLEDAAIEEEDTLNGHNNAHVWCDEWSVMNEWVIQARIISTVTEKAQQGVGHLKIKLDRQMCIQ